MDNVIEVSNLIKNFDVSKGFFSRNKTVVKAVDGISFSIPKGESLGLVGQSGCGKTTTARALCLLDPKTSGDVKFYNPEADEMQNLDDLSEEQVKQFRRNTQMIFQDPYESLNPRWTIKDIILEPLNIHNIGSLENRTEAVIEILKTVGLTPPQNYLPRYPHELSGGQRQRVDLAKDLQVSYLYITHDLAVARYMCNRIAVMFNGKIVEIAKTEDLLSNPIHPYTKRLISSIPVPDPKYTREKYNIDFTELDKIIADNTENLPMVDVGDEHYVATHDVKDLLI